MNKMINRVINKVKQVFKEYFREPVVVKPEPLRSLNQKDVQQLITAFPPFKYQKGMSHEDIVVGVMRADGEQRVLQFILSRIQGRVLAGPQYD